MNLFVYGDESGVFDKAHNDLFVFGGLIFLDKESKDTAYRKYISAERKIAPQYGVSDKRRGELKACPKVFATGGRRNELHHRVFSRRFRGRRGHGGMLCGEG